METSPVRVLLVADDAAPQVHQTLEACGLQIEQCAAALLSGWLEEAEWQGIVLGSMSEAALLSCLRQLRAHPRPLPVLLLFSQELSGLVASLAAEGRLQVALPSQTETLRTWAQALTTRAQLTVEERLKWLRQELSRLNHDLKNPLAIIAGNAQFMQELLRLSSDPSDWAGPVTDILEACERMNALLQRLGTLRDALLDA